MAAVAGPLHPMSAMQDDHVMDTRTPSPVQRVAAAESRHDGYKPDLSAEVALLSTKLVNAINYNTNLDDTLQASRHELVQQRQRCATLEAEKRRHDDLVSSGVLVNKSETEKTIARLQAELATERAARETAEKAKKQTEGEVENLTTALFEEANSMVAAARKDTEALERKNTQLKSQLEDSAVLLASQQEQLQDLKSTMEKLQQATPNADPSMPSTPVTTGNAMFDALQLSPTADGFPDLAPEHPLHFSQLISPVLRTDTSAFGDFQDLLLLARRLGAHSRNPSSNGAHVSPGLSTYANMAAASSSPNLPGAFSFSNNASPSSNYSGASLPPLKESKFYKRVLTEDIEPTLRLDLAPGLSFLSRRTVLGSLLAGTLAVEPYPQNKHYFACTLCGESRRTEQYTRKYRFRTGEDDTVAKPLCDYCVSRLRATCDFVGFLRMVRDGHWKCESEEDQKSGWEESVRLRERMFWSRLGGGVVPCLHRATRPRGSRPSSAVAIKSGRPSLESIPERQTGSGEDPSVGGGRSGASGASQEKSSGANDAATANASSRAAAVTTPENPPVKVPDAGFVTPPSTSELHSDEEDGSALVQPVNPFEDAAQQLQTSFISAATADRQLKKELEMEITSADSDETAVEDSPLSLRHSLPQPSSERPGTSPRNSLRGEEFPSSRKNSSVLERVRALQAASLQK